MIKIDDKARCCGCGSCARNCPKDAIKIREDKAGFLYPNFDADLCVECGLCEELCPVLNHKNEENTEHNVYIAFAKDRNDRLSGSSGGMFGTIAKNEMRKGAVVYAAAFDEKLKLRTASAKTEGELLPFYKSKYLQNDLADSFSKIKEQLLNGERVMFVSTPCQVWALKLFLRKDYDNLLTVDFVCHGVPSQKLFDRCKELTESEQGINIKDFVFRAKKKNGATPHYFKMKYIKGGVEHERTALYLEDYFYTGFQKYITLRDSCYDCQFSYSNRVSDITLGDFHEVDKYIKGINRFDGISTLVTNTMKGERVWEEIKDNTVFHQLDFKLLLENGELMCGGTQKPKGRDEFIYNLETCDFKDIVSKYLNGKRQIAKRVYYNMPNMVRKIMKKVWIRE